MRGGVQSVVGNFVYFFCALPWGIGLMMRAYVLIDSRPIFGLCVFLLLFSLFFLFMMIFLSTNKDWNSDFHPLQVTPWRVWAPSSFSIPPC